MKARRLLLVILIVVLAYSSLVDSVAAISPIASWNMDEGSGNLSGDSVGGYGGTIHGASWTPAAVVVNSSGKFFDLGSGRSGVYALDFKDSYVDVRDAAALNSGDFSIAFWVAPDSSSTWANIIMKQYWAEGASAGWMVCWDDKSPRLIRLVIFSPSHSESSSVGIPVDLGRWTHLAFSAGNGRIGAYKNGKLVGETALSGFLASTEPLKIGGNDGHYFDGLLDNVLFYNTTLAAEDVRSLYQSYEFTPHSNVVLDFGDVSSRPGQETNITVRLLDRRGTVLAGANISFLLYGQNLGTATTDSRGFASVPYNSPYVGTYSLTAEFAGLGGYDRAAKTAHLTVSQDPTPQYALIGLVCAVVVIVAVFLVIRYRREKQSTEELTQAIKDLVEKFERPSYY